MTDSGNVVRLVDLGAIEAEAAAWVARLDVATPSASDLAEFEAWKAQGAHYREAADRLDGLWSDLDVLGQLATPVSVGAPRWGRAWWGAHGRPIGPRPRFAAFAAGLVVVIVLAMTSSQLLAPRTDTYETAIGGQRTINLDDGSSVQLNTNSRLEVRYSGRARDLKLVKGEAFFEVAPNPRRPFSVYAQDGVVRAVGTAFVVRLRGEGVEVTVTKGTVELASLTRPAKVVPLDRVTSEPRRPLAMVSAMSGTVETAVLVQDSVESRAVSTPEATRRMAWRQGMLAFEGQPLSEVVADVSRYTNMEIEIADPDLRSLKVVGYFNVGEVEPMLEALETSFGVRVERLDPSHVRLTAAS